MNNSRKTTKKLVLAAILTALVVVLQLMGSFIRFGPFSISLVLIPIVLGAAMCGTAVSTWLGFVFGMVVLFQPDTQVFLNVSIFGTILTVLLKGIGCGFAAGVAYKQLEKVNRYLAVALAAVVCPVVNTGIFVCGCFAFFMDTISKWGEGTKFDGAVSYLFLGMIGANFLFELASNILLSPAVIRLLNISKKNI